MLLPPTTPDIHNTSFQLDYAVAYAEMDQCDWIFVTGTNDSCQQPRGVCGYAAFIWRLA